jgi:hypothetical protein
MIGMLRIRRMLSQTRRHSRLGTTPQMMLHISRTYQTHHMLHASRIRRTLDLNPNITDTGTPVVPTLTKYNHAHSPLQGMYRCPTGVRRALNRNVRRLDMALPLSAGPRSTRLRLVLATTAPQYRRHSRARLIILVVGATISTGPIGKLTIASLSSSISFELTRLIK